MNVRDGPTECVSAGLERRAEPAGRGGDAVVRPRVRRPRPALRTAELISVNDDPYRPQPRIDRYLNDGMSTVVGRVRPDRVLQNGIKFVLLSHNTKLGAAKGACLVAEYLVHQGLA